MSFTARDNLAGLKQMYQKRKISPKESYFYSTPAFKKVAFTFVGDC